MIEQYADDIVHHENILLSTLGKIKKKELKTKKKDFILSRIFING